MPIRDLCWRDGFSEATFYHWRAKRGDMKVSGAKRLRCLEAWNAKLTKLLAELHLDMDPLEAVPGLNR